MEKEYYTTGETARILGVSFKTIKRWIYDGKIKYIKTPGGHYRIPKAEIERIKVRTEDQHTRDIIDLLKKRTVAYFREIQVNLEDTYSHIETRDKLHQLQSKGLIRSQKHKKRRWFFLPEHTWNDVKDIVEEKNVLFEEFDNFERSFTSHNHVRYNDYAEYLVEQAMIRAGYTVVAKDAYYFNGFSYPSEGSRPSDLDFIAALPSGKIYVGIQVKNRLEYPKPEEIAAFIDLCRTLRLRPLLVARKVHRMTPDHIRRLGGWTVVFKQVLLKPGFSRESLQKLRNCGIPVAVYRYPPDYLIEKFEVAAEKIETGTNS